MDHPTLWLDRSLIARLLLPLLEPALTSTEWRVEMVERPGLDTLQREPGAALLDALDALALVPRVSIATDLAVATQHTSVVALATPERPDRIGSATVRLGQCRSASEALARATIEPFYGIRIERWVRETCEPDDHPSLRVLEDEAACAPLSERFHDLGRAWFVLTGEPFVSHLLVYSADLPQDRARQLASVLRDVPAQLRQRASELASDLAAAQALDAGRLHAFLIEAVDPLTPKARRGLAELVRRSRSGLPLPPENAYRSLAS